MRRIRLFSAISLIVNALVLTSACNGVERVDPERTEPVTVGLYAGGYETRTVVSENGLSTNWQDTDKIFVWAKTPVGTYALTNQRFGIYGRIDGSALFTSTLSEPMPENVNYTYYAVYPRPSAVSGTIASFELSANQDGLAGNGADILVAAPVQYGPLLDLEEQTSRLDMHFQHQMHHFRFYVPEDETALNGEKIEKIVVTMPRDVVGTVNIDFTDPDATMYLSNGQSVVTLDLTEQVSTGADGRKYANMVIFPTQFAEGETMTVTAYTDSKVATTNPIDLRARNFEAGHCTPVKIKDFAVKDRYKISFNLFENNLGEDITKMTFTAPSGSAFGDGGSNTYVYENAAGLGVNQPFFIEYQNRDDYVSMSGKTVTVAFESENATVSGSFTVPDLTASNSATANIAVPYLYFEDFSSFPTSNYNANAGTGSSSTGSNTAVDLSGSSYGWPSGWTGARCGSYAGDKIRICTRSQQAAYVAGNYYGRIDSPALSNIKASSPGVNILVQFDYTFGWAGSKSNNIPFYLAVGTHTTSGKIDSKSGYGLYLTGGYLSDTTFSTDMMITSGVTMEVAHLDGNNVWPATDHHMAEVATQKCTSASRLAFENYVIGYSGDGYYNYWIYIDNIKVSIQK